MSPRRARCPRGSSSRIIRPRRRRERFAPTAKIRWRGDLIATSTALVGEAVAAEETEDGQWLVRFHDVPIGLIDMDKKRLRRLVAPTGAGGEAQDQAKP